LTHLQGQKKRIYFDEYRLAALRSLLWKRVVTAWTMKRRLFLLGIFCLFFPPNGVFVIALCTVGGVKIVWFRSHALRTRDNDALRTAILEVETRRTRSAKTTPPCEFPVSNNPILRFVYLWDRPVHQGGTASDVFVANTLNSLNQTLSGRLDIVDCSSTRSGKALAKVMATTLTDYAQAVIGSEMKTVASSSDVSVEIFYMESFDRVFENLLCDELTLIRRGHDKTVKCFIQPRPFGGGHTLLEYDLNKDSNLNAAHLVQQAIQKHPFASPLIPFVDFVLHYLKQHPLLDEQLTPIQLVLGGSRHRNDSDSLTQCRRVSISSLLSQVGTTRSTQWGASIAQKWPATEDAAATALQEFVQSQYASIQNSADSSVNHDKEEPKKQSKRNHLTSNISPYVARGLLSPKQVYRSILKAGKSGGPSSSSSSSSKNNVESVQQLPQGSNSFLRRIAWRDYAYAVSTVFPEAVAKQRPIRSGYDNVDRRMGSMDGNGRVDSSEAVYRFHHWKCGTTGFPLVDAGMRQLQVEGFMPQKVRLAVSACLVEGFNASWRWGRQHFEDYLVDYDSVINTHMWMNAASVGLDPYYIGLDYKKRPYWDADGKYVRTWCPELQNLPDRIEVAPSPAGAAAATVGVPPAGGTNTVDALYTPWKAPLEVLHAAGVFLGESYPERICNEREGRRQFLQALRLCRSSWPASDQRMDEASGNDIVELGAGAVGGENGRIGVFTPRSLMISK
jgi:deoxyribodipyrimidine photolyase